MKAVSPNQTINFVVEDELKLKPEEQTVFVHSHLSAEQAAYIDDNTGYQGNDGYVVTMGRASLLALHLCLKEILNFTDEKGKVIKLERDKTKGKLPGGIRPIKMEILDLIPKKYRTEIAESIKKGEHLEEDEAKN